MIMKRVALVAMAGAIATAVACASRPGDVPIEAQSIDARRLVENGARLIDVRTPEEFAAGHIDGAVNIPIDELARRIGEIGAPETPVVVYCRSGRRSAEAARLLRAAGFSSVHDLGPMSAWDRP